MKNLSIRKTNRATIYYNDTHKSCSECKQIKKHNEFHKSKRSFLGIVSKCKECRKIDTNKYYIENRKDVIYKQKERSSKLKLERQQYDKLRYIQKNEEIKSKSKEYRENNAIFNEDRLPLGYETRNKDDLLQAKCYKCKEWIFVTNQQLNNTLQSQKGNAIGQSNIYCSNECKRSCDESYGSASTLKELQAFELGLSLFEYDLLKNNSKDITALRLVKKIAKERDNYTCQRCGSKENLHGHHIKPMSLCIGTDDEYLIYDTSNIKTVCSDCHYKVYHVDELSVYKLNNDNKISICFKH